MAVAAASLLAALPAAAEHTEVIELELKAGAVEHLQIDTGAGPLEITGVPDTDRIRVRAEIRFPDADADEAAEILAERLRLTLEQGIAGAELVAEFNQTGWRAFLGESPTMSLDVRVPERYSLEVEDGSGSLAIRDVRGDIDVDDGSGGVTINGVEGDLTVLDAGSGSLRYDNIGGKVEVRD